MCVSVCVCVCVCVHTYIHTYRESKESFFSGFLYMLIRNVFLKCYNILHFAVFFLKINAALVNINDLL